MDRLGVVMWTVKVFGLSDRLAKGCSGRAIERSPVQLRENILR
jgi:hypothetical protein